jgi:hypothetical protein
MGLPQLLAGLDVEKRQDEENYREQEHDQILHLEVSHFLMAWLRAASPFRA